MAIATETLMEAEYVSLPTVIWIIIVLMSLTIILALPAYGLYAISRTLCAKGLTERKSEEAKAVFLKFIGKKPKYINTDWMPIGDGSISGTGIALSDGALYLMDKGVAAKIQFPEIRTWRWIVPGADRIRVIRGNHLDHMAANRQNANAALIAYLDSGIFVSVHDIDKPEWQFMSKDVEILKRWHEILLQGREQE